MLRRGRSGDRLASKRRTLQISGAVFGEIRTGKPFAMLNIAGKWTAIAAAAVFACSAWHGAKASESVPFVGCPSDGQLGPIAAPKGAAKAVDLDAATASQLAYYQAKESFGVLAPRGWKCFYVYGSSGASLAVAPSGNLQDTGTSGLGGPAVVESVSSGGTSGRFAVAKYSARLFPKLEQAFIASVIAEGIEPKKNFPFGPYPADKTDYKTGRLLEFETPANSDGLGTSDRLRKDLTPIRGMAKLEESVPPGSPDFYLLTVRLPANQAHLSSAIIAEAE
jgi:hypothetical protein